MSDSEVWTSDEQYRELTDLERNLLRELTDQDFQGAKALRDQVNHARARQGCGCGCGTIDLEVDQVRAPRAEVVKNPIPGEAAVSDAEGDPLGGLIAFARDGYLSCLEIYSIGDPAPLPRLDQIRAFVRSD